MEVQTTKQSIRSFLKKLPLKFLLIAGLFVAGLYLFALITHEVIIEKEEEFDNKLIHFFAPYSAERFIRVMKVFTFFGSGKFLIPAYAVIVTYFLIKRQAIIGLNIAIIAITSTVLSHIAKRIFQRGRPGLPLIDHLKTFSFPSSHALSSFIFCSILVYLVWRSSIGQAWKWVLSIFLFLFSITIGMSRIVLKMHYATDVLAGFCLGFIWAILSFYVLNRMQSTRSKRNRSETEAA